jgi:hypothetical protein
MEAFEPNLQPELPTYHMEVNTNTGEVTAYMNTPPPHTIDVPPGFTVEVPHDAEEVKEEPKAKRGRKKKEVEPVVEEAAIEEVPSNFYSFLEFQSSFVQILGVLTKSKVLSHDYIEEACKKYSVAFIYMLIKDSKKLESFYNDLVKDGVIVKKGDY